MLRFTLPVCVMLAFAMTANATPKAKAAPGKRRVAKQAVTKQLTKDEKLALAWLGQIGAASKSKAAAAKAVAARRQFAVLPAKAKLRPLVKALHCEPASLRVFAADALATLGNREVVRPLLWRLIREPKKDARAAMVRAVRSMKDKDAVHVLGRALRSRYETYRDRAAEALVALGDELAYPYLIYKWEGRGGDFPRVYFVLARQHSYIQDFDVEVAATAFIADPIVGVLQDATALGVKVIATEQIQHLAAVRTFRGALEGLGGVPKGAKVGAWRSWWTANEKRLLAKRAKRYAEP